MIDQETLDELESNFYRQAREDSLELQQRYVPACSVWASRYSGTKGMWCVVDTYSETITSSGLTFKGADVMARDLSEHEKNIERARL